MRALDPDNESGLMAKLSDAFERTAHRLEAEMLAAAQDGPDLQRLRRAAHTLKSSSANLAALRLSAQCQQLETLCLGGNADAAVAALAQLQPMLRDARQAVRQLA